MPWLRVVWKLGKLKVMKSHDGDLFLHWGHVHLLHLPRLRLPKLARRQSRRHAR